MTAPLPVNIDAEEAVLGALFVEPERIPEALAALRGEDFSDPRNRSVFEALLALATRSVPADLVTVGYELEHSGTFAMVGGRTRLLELTMTVTSAAHLRHHMRIVADVAARRRVISEAEAIAREGRSLGPVNGTATEFLRLAVERIGAAAEVPAPAAVEFAERDVRELRDKIDAGPVEGVDGLQMGFRDLDTIVCGMRPGDLVVIAARPAVGKTTLASNIAAQVALRDAAEPVALFSLEMGKQSLLERFASAHSGVDHYLIRSRRLSTSNREKVDASLIALEFAPLAIDDTSGQTMMSIRASARRLRQRRGLGLVLVDYLQLVQYPGAENRLQEVSAISRGLKALAAELSVPVIAAAQLNRAADAGPEQRPRLSHLRESGSIEADADIVILLHQVGDATEASDPRTIEAIVAKNRNGPVGTARLLLQPNLVRFVDLARTEQ